MTKKAAASSTRPNTSAQAAAPVTEAPAVPKDVSQLVLPTTLEATMSALAAYQKRCDDTQEDSIRFNNQLFPLQQDMKAAAAKEDYETAAALKKQVQQKSAVIADLKSDIQCFNNAMHALHQHATKLYFGDNTPTFSTDYSVTHVLAVDPKTGNQGETYYCESNRSTQLHVPGCASFEDEAVYIGDWALKHGLLVQYRTRTVDFAGPADAR